VLETNSQTVLSKNLKPVLSLAEGSKIENG